MKKQKKKKIVKKKKTKRGILLGKVLLARVLENHFCKKIYQLLLAEVKKKIPYLE